MREIVNQAKDRPCMDCERCFPPWVMDLDHRDSDDKVDVVSALVKCGSVSKLLAEIKKCDVVCSNCHRLRTHDRLVLSS